MAGRPPSRRRLGALGTGLAVLAGVAGVAGLLGLNDVVTASVLVAVLVGLSLVVRQAGLRLTVLGSSTRLAPALAGHDVAPPPRDRVTDPRHHPRRPRAPGRD